MEILVRSLQAAGGYSHTLVVPKSWLDQLGHPKKVKIIVGRKKLTIYPDEESGNGDGKQG